MCVRFAHFWTNIVQFWSHFGLLTPYLVPRHDWGKNTQYLCLLSVFTFVLGLLICFKVAVILVFSHLQLLLHDQSKKVFAGCVHLLRSSLTFWYVSILQSFWSSHTVNRTYHYMTEVRTLNTCVCCLCLPSSLVFWYVSKLQLFWSFHTYNCYYMTKVRKCLLGVSTFFVRPWLFDMFQFCSHFGLPTP